MLITKEGLQKRLEDGRWHTVSPGAIQWFLGKKEYEWEYKPFTTRLWKPGVTVVLYTHGPRTLFRIRKKHEFLDEVFRRETSPPQVSRMAHIRAIEAGYEGPDLRDGCGHCKHSQPEGTNTRLWCTNAKPRFKVSKYGICRSFERDKPRQP
jgi:hypothetical protein